jgi:Holliday junction resolvase RusA-like endonuclease
VIDFTAYCTPQPQGSSRAFVIGGKARITSANAKLKPFRQAVTSEAIECAYAEGHAVDERGAFFGKHVPVRLVLEFTFRKPPSLSKKRVHQVVKPDLDKIVRATGDALTGVIYHDDSQVVEIVARKRYGAVESVRVVAEEYT